jgi:serine protease
MTRRLTLTFLAALAIATQLFAATTSRYMVVPREGAEPGRMPRLIANSAESAAHHVRRFDHAGSFAIDLTEDEAAELRRSGEALSVEPVTRFYALELDAPALPDVNLTQQQVMPWGVEAIHAPSVWPVSRGLFVNVVVIDSGIDSTHPDLAAAYAGGYNTIHPELPPLDDHGHGTHVAGIIAAQDNQIGTVGVAPKAKLWAAKMLAADGSGSEENLIAALDWTIGKKKELGGPWVANMSIGAPDGTPALAAAIQRALDERVILVAAAGNGSRPWLQFPAAYRGVISVGAVDSGFEVASFSQYSGSLSLVAPGVDIPSSVLRGKFQLAEVNAGTEILTAYGITGSPMTTVQAPYINCGFGRPQDFTAAVQGRICVIERSPAGSADALPFRDKARNAKDAGAVAVIIFNDDDAGRNDYTKWTFIPEEWPEYQFPLTVAMSFADGARLLTTLGGTITISYGYKEYGLLTGTSMAAPHVTGTVALLLALAPETNNAQMVSVLQRTTTDVSVRGWDVRTSWGMVDALRAAETLTPWRFGVPAQPPPSNKRRSVRP